MWLGPRRSRARARHDRRAPRCRGNTGVRGSLATLLLLEQGASLLADQDFAGIGIAGEQPLAPGVLPDGETRTAGAPGLHHLAIIARARADPLKHLQRQCCGGPAHRRQVPKRGARQTLTMKISIEAKLRMAPMMAMTGWLRTIVT